MTNSGRWAALAAGAIFAANSAMAGSVYYGGDIITMAGDQPQYVDAIAVEAGKIVAVGSREAAVKAVGSQATLIDLKGQTLLPGFIDAHSHLMQTAAKLSAVALDAPPAGDILSIDDIVDKLNAELAANPRGKGQWLVGVLIMACSVTTASPPGMIWTGLALRSRSY